MLLRDLWCVRVFVCSAILLDLGAYSKPPWEDFRTKLEREESIEMAVKQPDREMVPWFPLTTMCCRTVTLH